MQPLKMISFHFDPGPSDTSVGFFTAPRFFEDFRPKFCSLLEAALAVVMSGHKFKVFPQAAFKLSPIGAFKGPLSSGPFIPSYQVWPPGEKLASAAAPTRA